MKLDKSLKRIINNFKWFTEINTFKNKEMKHINKVYLLFISDWLKRKLNKIMLFG